MSFWPVVVTTLIGAPTALCMVALMTIFGAAALANAGRSARANVAAGIGLVLCWLLAAAFGAVGLAPAWRAWHGGAENFAGAPLAFVHWLAGTAVAALACVAWLYAKAKLTRDAAGNAQPSVAMKWLVVAFVMLCWGAIVGWLAWPLVLWPVHGHFYWPVAATGWTHSIAVAAILFAVGVLETGVRKLLKR